MANTFISTGSDGTGVITIDGAGSTLTSIAATSGGINVGSNNGTGTLNVQNGGVYSGSDLNVGLNSHSNNAVNLTGPNSQINISGSSNTDTVDIGIAGAGTLNISNGAQFSIVDGNTSLGSGAGSSATLNIQSGGHYDAGNNTIVAGTGPSTAVITVDGTGSQLTTTSTVSLANNGGSATLNIQNGANATINFLVSGSNDANTGTTNVQSGGSLSTNTLGIGSNTISGADGTLNLTGSSSTVSSATVNVGDSGIGRLNISNNAVFTASVFTTFGRGSGNSAIVDIQSGGKYTHTGTGFTKIGEEGGNAAISIDGNGSQITVNSTINMGIIGGGGGTIDVTNGGMASFQSTLINQGVINVNGTNSTLSTGQESLSMGGLSGGNVTLNIGDNPNTGDVESAGTVNSVSGTVSGNVTSTVTANVSGANAEWNLLGLRSSGSGAQLTVGSRGIGTLNINNQGTVTIDAQGTPTGFLGGISVGGQTGGETSTGTVNIDGAGATLTVASGFGRFGERGTGTVNVANGATLDTSGTVIDMIARKTTSTGTVSVTGAGSTWNAGANIYLGSDFSFSTQSITGPGGNGTLNVANNGAVFAQDIFNAASGRITGGGGTITGNVHNDGTIAAGNSPGLMSIVGNLNHNAGATIEVEIGGTVFNTGIPQFDYDRIDVSDDPATTGTTEGIFTIDPAAIFSVEFISGFSAAEGDSFDILIADTIVGLITESNFVLPTLTAGLIWDGGVFDVGGRSAIRLFVTADTVAATAPGALLILIGGVGVLAFLRRRRDATIH